MAQMAHESEIKLTTAKIYFQVFQATARLIRVVNAGQLGHVCIVPSRDHATNRISALPQMISGRR